MTRQRPSVVIKSPETVRRNYIGHRNQPFWTFGVGEFR